MVKTDQRPGVIIIEGHVQGLANTRSLGRAGIPVVVVDKNECLAQYSKYCQKIMQCPDYASREFIDFLVNLGQNENYKNWILLPSNDHAVWNIARHLEKLQDDFLVPVPHQNIIDRICNKENLLKLADQIDIPIPKTVYGWPQNHSLNFPALTKGKKGLTFYKKTGKKAFVSQNKEELQKQLSLISSYIPVTETFTQSIINAQQKSSTISFTSFVINGAIKTFWMGVKIREHPAQFGTGTFCKSVYIPELLTMSKKLLRELNYSGVCEIEFLLDKQTKQYKLIEINPRTWLWVGLAVASGINYPLILYNYLHNIDQEYPTEYKTGLFWRNTWTDRVYSFLEMLKFQLNYFQYRTSIKSNQIIPAIKDEDDMLPYYHTLRLFVKRSLL